MGRTIQAGMYAQPVKSDGTLAVAAGERGTYTLSSSSIYYVEVNAQTSTVESLHLQWDSALVGTITLESSDFSPHEAAITSTDGGDWIQQNPSTAYVPITGTGASVANLTITLAGGGAGGAQINLSDLGPARLRLKVDVTTGGVLRVADTGKA